MTKRIQTSFYHYEKKQLTPITNQFSLKLFFQLELSHCFSSTKRTKVKF